MVGNIFDDFRVILHVNAVRFYGEFMDSSFTHVHSHVRKL
jgi:hypothetical protein